MGIDLCLYPCISGNSGNNVASPDWLAGTSDKRKYQPNIHGYSRLDFDRDYDLFDQIEGFNRGNTHKIVVPVYPIPPNTLLGVYDEPGMKYTDKTPYGDRLEFAWVRDMKKIVPSDRMSDWNRAVLAFIKVLPDNALCVLWWH